MPPESHGQAQRVADIAPLVLGVKISAQVGLQFDQDQVYALFLKLIK